jgi:hypothetical protein
VDEGTFEYLERYEVMLAQMIRHPSYSYLKDPVERDPGTVEEMIHTGRLHEVEVAYVKEAPDYRQLKTDEEAAKKAPGGGEGQLPVKKRYLFAT